MLRHSGKLISTVLSILALVVECRVGAAQGQGPSVQEAKAATVKAFAEQRRMQVLTFVGYSGAQYEDPQAMLRLASRVLDCHDPTTTIVNIGATDVGIGAVYELAKRKGFTTIGIVSSRAREEGARLSPHVDQVFFVRDKYWGGLVPGTEELSPTSAAIVECSAVCVAIGGGEVARDEMLAARRAGRQVTFLPADMNHRLAREKARKNGQSEPSDFRGAAHAALAP